MIEIWVLGNEETAGWLRRKEESLCAAGLSCDFISMENELHLTDRPDVWLVDSDACGCRSLADVLEELHGLGHGCSVPAVVMGRSISPGLAIRAVHAGARRFLERPLTPRTLANACRDLGIADILTSQTAVVLEDRDDILAKICQPLAARSIKVLQARSLEEVLKLLRNHDSDAIVLSHSEDSLSFQEILSLLDFFPESSGIPVVSANKGCSDLGERRCLSQIILEQAGQRVRFYGGSTV